MRITKRVYQKVQKIIITARMRRRHKCLGCYHFYDYELEKQFDLISTAALVFALIQPVGAQDFKEGKTAGIHTEPPVIAPGKMFLLTNEDGGKISPKGGKYTEKVDAYLVINDRQRHRLVHHHIIQDEELAALRDHSPLTPEQFEDVIIKGNIEDETPEPFYPKFALEIPTDVKPGEKAELEATWRIKQPGTPRLRDDGTPPPANDFTYKYNVEKISGKNTYKVNLAGAEGDILRNFSFDLRFALFMTSIIAGFIALSVFRNARQLEGYESSIQV